MTFGSSEMRLTSPRARATISRFRGAFSKTLVSVAVTKPSPPLTCARTSSKVAGCQPPSRVVDLQADRPSKRLVGSGLSMPAARPERSFVPSESRAPAEAGDSPADDRLLLTGAMIPGLIIFCSASGARGWDFTGLRPCGVIFCMGRASCARFSELSGAAGPRPRSMLVVGASFRSAWSGGGGAPGTLFHSPSRPSCEPTAITSDWLLKVAVRTPSEPEVA
mmetsp:Transcript_47410/g.106447  ORF Transcript_47410/g.106447 Transcript_47410/m.106447 type:complete len:221 (-) Transcript_47410:79-741(-)